jgi:hypothetical protein
MAELVTLAVASAVFAALYLGFRSAAYPNEPSAVLPSRDRAIAEAAEAIRELCGLDVRGFRAHAALAFEDRTIEQLDHLGAAVRLRSFTLAWGLRGAWRVRFVTDGGSAVVKLSPLGDVLALELVGAPRKQVLRSARGDRGDAPQSALRDRLGRGRAGIWTEVRPVGEGYDQDDEDVTIRSTHFRLQNCELWVEAHVDHAGYRILGVDCSAEVRAADLQFFERAEQREAVASAGGVLASVFAFVGAVCVLAFVGGLADIQLTGALLLVLLMAVIPAEADGARYAIVNAYDGVQPWRTFRAITLLASGASVAVLVGVSTVAALAGSLVANRIGVALVHDPWRQLTWGITLATTWLGVAAMSYAVLRRLRWARVSPTPDRRSLQTAGLDARYVLSVTLQSAIGEETIFRLLATSVLVWATGEPVLAACVTGVAWAAVHSGAAVRPRWVRSLELSMVGVALGLAFVHLGFLTVLVAHLVYNVVTLSVPLLAGAKRADESGTSSEDRSPMLASSSAPVQNPEPVAGRVETSGTQ